MRVTTALGAVLLCGEVAAQAPDFARDVLPLLSDRCFSCHGPDANARKADLRLDERESALASHSYDMVPIVPGDLGRSGVWRRITTADEDDRMPPADSGLRLSAAEIETLRRWIEAGAAWAPHWSFLAPVETVVPKPEPDSPDASWPRSDLDRFVLAGLTARGLRPSPPAEPAAWLRRVSLDLTGLPPTPAQLDAFEADPSDAAYERIVDELLASHRYGERMAWPWLEAARYADTDGYQSDPTRAMWPWRDWLVRSLNANVPFDRLTTELLAGDLLPGATQEQRLASAFHRNHAYNGEGGRIAEETRVENVFDRTETTATVWLGLTMECARCHDHKFDPIAQRDYYALFAFFDQTSESGSTDAPGRRPPTMRYVDADLARRIGDVDAAIRALRERRDGRDEELDREQTTWESAALARVTSKSQSLAPIELLNWRERGPGPRAQDAIALLADDGWRTAPGFVDRQPYTLPEVVGTTYFHRVLRATSARRLVLSFGSDDGIRVFWNGALVLAREDVRRGVAPDQERIEVEARVGDNELLLEITNTGGPGGAWFRVVEETIDGISIGVAKALATPVAARTAAASSLLREAFREERQPGRSTLTAELAAAESERARLLDSAPEVMVMDELPADRQRSVFVLERGAYDQPREAVEAATPPFLPPLDDDLPGDAPRNRLALARWLTAENHPLTARVAANRAWQLFFGRGLVETSEDFGRQGARPTHPELLDWLARRYVATGWDTKALHRAIVLSATYRQSTAAAPTTFADDPDAALLQRAPRPRLPAWMLRDQALALGDLLVERAGGPPVRPYQPDGVWEEATFDAIRYEQDRGEALHRRSLYTFWRRIVGPTTLFDTPSRQNCVVRTKPTNSPLHALVLRNDPTFVEAARAFATRTLREGGSTDEVRLAWAFRTATARRPTATELAVLTRRLASARAHFHSDENAAKALLAVGEAPLEASWPPVELAALTVVTLVLLNLDEVLCRP